MTIRLSDVDPVEFRGWKEICAFLGVKDKRTARKILMDLDLLVYDKTIPVLNKMVYLKASGKRHMAG